MTPSFYRSRGIAVLLAVTAALVTGGAVKDKSYIADAIVQLLQEHRSAAGAPRLERRAALDEAAARRAGALARRAPEMKLVEEEPMDTLLRESGVLRYQRVQEHVEMQQGYADASGAAVGRWRQATETWSMMMDPRMSALGVATVVGDDGWLVLVTVFLEDLHVPDDLGEWEARLLASVNRIRVKHGLSPQFASSDLSRIARLHSEDMARRDFFAHASPEGHDLSHRVMGFNLEYLHLAENIGRNRGQEDPVEVAIDGWMNSPAHRKNILDGDLIQCGIGIAMDERGMFYFTQIFLQPPRS
ncbi:MAG: CAP domain-containing protein [Acidobacteria bacterium]|nr:MAG: CAP domain-containing protein [Acidobacteriota bacterium]